MKSHPARILLLIGFALFIILLFVLISCNTIPDKYQVQQGITVDQDKRLIRALYEDAYLKGWLDAKRNENNWARDSLALELLLIKYYK